MSNNHPNISLLYVDDEEFNLFLFEMNFKDRYTIYSASSGAAALDLLKDHQDEIIVVISDMMMPGMTGVEFIRKARETHDKVAYFILSAFNNNKDIEAAIKNGEVVEFINKPFVKEKMEDLIDNAAANLDNN